MTDCYRVCRLQAAKVYYYIRLPLRVSAHFLAVFHFCQTALVRNVAADESDESTALPLRGNSNRAVALDLSV